jgi:hypothetical protein
MAEQGLSLEEIVATVEAAARHMGGDRSSRPSYITVNVSDC